MWNLTQCAVQGRSHIDRNIPCQDKTFCLSENGVSVIALADGAGSASLSHYGAEAVTQKIARTLISEFDSFYANRDGNEVKEQLIAALLSTVSDLAETLGCEKKELASTLLAVAVKDDRFLLLHLGDGVIGYLKNGMLKTASAPTNGEFANVTIFVTSKDAASSMRIIKGELGSITGFLLMSDGSEASLYSKKKNMLATSLSRILNLSALIRADKMEEMLRQSFETKVRHQTTDDCSIAMMARDPDFCKGFQALNYKQARKYLSLPTDCNRKTVRRYRSALLYMTTPRTEKQIARYIHLKPAHAKRYLLHLLELNYIETDGVRYTSILKITNSDASSQA